MLTLSKYKELKSKGITDKQIAETYFMSTATLSRWKAKNNTIAGRKPEEYIKLRKQGYRDYQIHKLWNISPSALYQWKKPKNLIGVNFNDS